MRYTDEQVQAALRGALAMEISYEQNAILAWLAAEYPNLHADVARLDWLIDTCLYFPTRFGGQLDSNSRAAIDEAMK